MHYYLASYTGDGSSSDPFRPNTDVQGWSAVDLRPDPTQQAGRCLLALPIRQDPPASRYIGEDPDAVLSAAGRNALGNALGLTVDSGKGWRSVVADLLIRDGRNDGTRWKPLRPAGHMYEVWLGGLFWQMPVISGGAPFTESFNTADSDTLGPDLTWTEAHGDLDIVSNRAATTVSPTGTAAARVAVLWSDAQYAQVKVWLAAPPASAENRAGPMVRFVSPMTAYVCEREETSGGTHRLRLARYVSFADTQLADTTGLTLVDGDLYKISADGSTIKAYQNGTERFSATDTNITGNTQCGIRASTASGGAAGDAQFDDFEAADLYAQVVPSLFVITSPMRW